VPTVIITSRDDPFAPAEAFLNHTVAPSVHLHVERSGGHMGYVSRNLRDRRWVGQLLGPSHGSASARLMVPAYPLAG
jgi:predicted alpha/beta-fold hydrolase